MPNLNIPLQMLEAIEQLRGVVQEKAEPLDATPQGKEILELLEDVQRNIAIELKIFLKIMAAERYHARIVTFGQVKKGNRLRWLRTGLQLAEPEFLGGDVEHLRNLMIGTMKATEGRSIAVWLHPMPLADNGCFYAFVKHQDGLEAVFAIDDSRWMPLGWGKAHLDLSLEMLLRPSKGSERRWTAILDAQIRALEGPLRVDVDGFLTKCPNGPLPDELWTELLSIIYLREDNRRLMQEAARATSLTLMIESQRLLSAMTELIEKALAAHDEKMAHREKTHARVLKRFKTDLDKHKAAKELSVNRALQLGREVQELRKQMQQTSPEPTQQSTQRSIGLALDHFFQ